MRTKLPIRTFLGIVGVGLLALPSLAQPPLRPIGGIAGGTAPSVAQPITGAPAAEGEKAPQRLLERAILALEGRHSISAKIRHRVDVLGKRLVGSGTYLEQRSPEVLQLRMELKIQVGGQATNFLQVCDGQYLWTYQKGTQDPGTLTRIAVVRVAQALEEMGETREAGRVGSWLGMGGLPKLLRSLNAFFQFVSVEEGRLDQDQTPVWRLHGQWKPEQIARLLPDQAAAVKEGKPTKFSKLPPHMPDHVVLYLGKENLFPYNVEYYRLEPNPKARYSVPADRILVAVELFDVVTGAPIPSTRFVYHPGNLDFTDQTEAYLQSLGEKK